MSRKIHFDIDDIPGTLRTWGNNFTRNSTAAFTNLTAKNAIQLVIVIGAYALLIRPVLVSIGARIQAKQHVEASQEAEAEWQAKLSANNLRGVAIPGVDSDSDEDDEVKANVKVGQWGRKARVRQRNIVRRLLVEKEERGLEDESDEELRDLLED
jgi:hypothetical protein